MTPEQLQSEIAALFAESKRLMADGERRAASHLLGIMRRFQGYLPQKPVVPPSAPVEAPEPVAPPVEPGEAEPPKRRFRKPKGV